MEKLNVYKAVWQKPAYSDTVSKKFEKKRSVFQFLSDSDFSPEII